MEQDRDAVSLAQIKAGGLPLNAIERLTEQARRIGTPQEFFTSDLSVSELLLTHECGYEPLGQVMGSCVYNVGFQFQNYAWGAGYQSGEFQVMSQAQSEARRLAFSRLKQEAALLGADGVVGVQMTRKGTAERGGMVEFIAIGTAVRRNNAPKSDREPFLSDLSGQDHWALRKAGFKPVGFVYGNCSWCQYPDYQYGGIGFTWKNVEYVQTTQGVYSARATAASRMDSEARQVGATGVVGTFVEFDVERVQPDKQPMFFLIHFCLYGTAITPDPLAEEESKKHIPYFISLSNPK